MLRKWSFCSRLLSLTNVTKSFNKPKENISNEVGLYIKPRKTGKLVIYLKPYLDWVRYYERFNRDVKDHKFSRFFKINSRRKINFLQRFLN